MSSTITGWGSYASEGAPISLEYAHYTIVSNNKLFALEQSQVVKLMSTNFFERGMNNYYNALVFSTSVQSFRWDTLTSWQDYYGIGDYYQFSLPMQYMV